MSKAKIQKMTTEARMVKAGVGVLVAFPTLFVLNLWHGGPLDFVVTLVHELGHALTLVWAPLPFPGASLASIRLDNFGQGWCGRAMGIASGGVFGQLLMAYAMIRFLRLNGIGIGYWFIFNVFYEFSIPYYSPYRGDWENPAFWPMTMVTFIVVMPFIITETIRVLSGYKLLQYNIPREIIREWQNQQAEKKVRVSRMPSQVKPVQHR